MDYYSVHGKAPNPQRMWGLSGIRYALHAEWNKWGRTARQAWSPDNEDPKLGSLDSRTHRGAVRSVNMHTTNGWLRMRRLATFSWTVWGRGGKTEGDQPWRYYIIIIQERHEGLNLNVSCIEKRETNSSAMQEARVTWLNHLGMKGAQV